MIAAASLQYPIVWSVLDAAAVSGVRSSGIRYGDYPVVTRTAAVQVVTGGDPTGIEVLAVSDAPSIVSVSPAALAGADGFADFTLTFKAPGRAVITFTEPVFGVSDSAWAISRETA
jgi:hypothetical protein